MLFPCHLFIGRFDIFVLEMVTPIFQQRNATVNVEVIFDATHAPFISNTEYFAKRLVKAQV